MTLGQKIKKLRTEKRMTQKELADQLNVTFQTVSKWESDTNEPDISTLKELAKFFGCSINSLLGDEEEEEPKQEAVEEPPVAPTEVITKTVVVHQHELHVCERCNKDIPENDLAMEDICVRPGGRGRSAEYRKAYYHKQCFEELKKEREIKRLKDRAEHASRAKKISFGWGIAGGVVALVVALLVLLLNPSCKEAINPGIAVLLSILAGYGIFSMLYCILTGSYIGDVFIWCAGLSFRAPGIIFTWDIEGFAFLIVMKIFFAILGVVVGILALLFAIAMSAALGMVSFPFVLIHNIHTEYEDAF